jgi:hypothetical protein
MSSPIGSNDSNPHPTERHVLRCGDRTPHAFNIDGRRTNCSHSAGSIRDADATGTVDGVTFVEPNIPGFQATLQTDSFGTVERCTPI